MANTRRESTASYRSEDIADSAGSHPVPALGFSPHLFTAVDAICQEPTSVPLPVREPMISRIGDAVDAAFALHARANGATVSVIDGNMAGRKLYAVSINPERICADQRSRVVEAGTRDWHMVQLQGAARSGYRCLLP
jgi:hypothetical protein